MPLAMVTGGALGVIGGVVAGIGGAKKSRRVGVAALLLLAIASSLILGPAVYLNTILDDTFARLQLNPTSAVQFTPKEQSLLDMTATLFNTCCFAVYDPRCGTRYNNVLDPNCNEASLFATGNVGVDVNMHTGSASIRDNQLPVRECGSASVCASEIFPSITNLISGIQELLCTCYSNQASFDKWEAVFTKLDSCKTMRRLKALNVGPVEIPKTPLKFGDLQRTLSVPLGRPPLQPCPPSPTSGTSVCAETPIKDIAVVGKMWAPEEIYPPNDIEESPGWSCGFGYAKGVAFTMYLALDQASEIAIYGAFGTGGLMAFVVLMEALYWALGGGASEDDWNVDHYSAEGYQ